MVAPRRLAASSLLLSALCLLAGCGGGGDPKSSADAAQAALSAGNFPEARTQAEAGLKAAAGSTDKSLLWKLERLRVEALARQGDAPETIASMERLSAAYPAQCDAQFYSKIGIFLNEAGQAAGALDVAHAGQTKFPERKTEFDGLIEELKQAASGNAELTEKLRTMGYL